MSRNGGLVNRLQEALEERTGFALADREKLNLMESQIQDAQALSREAELLGWSVLDYMSGNPNELSAKSRREWAQKSRMVWMQDATAGAAVDLMNDFVFGRGVPKPRAKDPKVQEVIDEAWDDPDNQLILTSYTAQMALGIDLALQSNLFFLMFDDGEDGKVKLGLLNHDEVDGAVVDPDFRQRVFYYLARHRRQEWDFKNHRLKVDPNQLTDQIDPTYYEHWRNIDAAKDEGDTVGAPDKKLLGKGRVYHVALNRTSEQVFGSPTMRRLLRWFSAYNDFLAARVDMAQAGAAFIMRRKIKGTPNQVAKMASKMVSRRSELAAATGTGDSMAQLPPMAGAILTENENVTHENLSLDTKSGNAQADAQMIRSVISSITRFPQCHDEQTETLTSEGWRTLSELRADMASGSLRVASFDTETSQIVFDRPLAMTDEIYSGPMVKLANDRRFDLLVTPNHRMYVQDNYKADTWRVVEARELRRAGLYAKLAAAADGVRVDDFVLPGLDESQEVVYSDLVAQEAVALRQQGRPHREIAKTLKRSEGWVEEALCGEPSWRDQSAPGALTVKMDAWMRFLGWYIAEGGAGGVCQQIDGDGLADIQGTCRELGVPGIEWITEGQRRTPIWRWEPAQGYRKLMRRWLNANVGRGSAEKRIPEFVFGLAREQRALLLDALLAGDGNQQSVGFNQFFTISRRLADDVQRLAVLDGRRATLKKGAAYQSRRGERQGWWVYVASGTSGRNSRRDQSWGQLPAPQTVDYEGSVYCFTTTHGTVVTRRNGRVAITGNSYYGDASNSNLATATSLELPVLKAVESRQEVFEGVFRWFIDRVIERAVETGSLDKFADEPETAEDDTSFSGTGDFGPDSVPVGDASLAEALELQMSYEDQTDDEDQTERDLSYEFSMPNPLKRAMTDLFAAIAQFATTLDPNGTNIELSRILATIGFGEGFEMQDPADVVEKIFPANYQDPALAQAMGNPFGAGQGPAPAQPSPFPQQGADGVAHNDPNNPYGAPGMSSAYQNGQGQGQNQMQQASVTTGRNGQPVYWVQTPQGPAALDLEEVVDRLVEARFADLAPTVAAPSKGEIDVVAKIFDEEMAGVVNDELTASLHNGAPPPEASSGR